MVARGIILDDSSAFISLTVTVFRRWREEPRRLLLTAEAIVDPPDKPDRCCTDKQGWLPVAIPDPSAIQGLTEGATGTRLQVFVRSSPQLSEVTLATGARLQVAVRSSPQAGKSTTAAGTRLHVVVRSSPPAAASKSAVGARLQVPVRSSPHELESREAAGARLQVPVRSRGVRGRNVVGGTAVCTGGCDCLAPSGCVAARLD
mmetsp:Transcript_32901/g.94547  ORF Transcript_32901/g.94547 Transcript_32901/m.94547 type:complete len:203 (+) Transcript_32901:1894-2502(+)